jgi:hypothetical protein
VVRLLQKEFALISTSALVKSRTQAQVALTHCVTSAQRHVGNEQAIVMTRNTLNQMARQNHSRAGVDRPETVLRIVQWRLGARVGVVGAADGDVKSFEDAAHSP